jgi:acetyl-CoA carboxylase biotin carboxyl carrier protein
VFRFEGLAVADDKRDVPRPFDVRTIEYLLKLMSEHDLSEIALQEGDQRIRLRRATAAAPVFYPAPPAVAHAAPPVAYAPGSPNSAPSAPATPAAPAKNLIEIKSPMVGTFYSKPKPDKPDYVTTGTRVTPKSVVCQIEAMKLFNEIVAECSGTVVEVCVKNGDAVEYNQPLFRIDPS